MKAHSVLPRPPIVNPTKAAVAAVAVGGGGPGTSVQKNQTGRVPIWGTGQEVREIEGASATSSRLKDLRKAGSKTQMQNPI
jgi:hypothetical protein